jgi:hypothetical protein
MLAIAMPKNFDAFSLAFSHDIVDRSLIAFRALAYRRMRQILFRLPKPNFKVPNPL